MAHELGRMKLNNEKQAVIDCQKLYHNINIIKNELPPNTKLIAVIKGSAYGHGLRQMASVLSKNTQIDMLAVSSLQEAVVIAESPKPIVILYSVVANNIISACIDNDLVEFIRNKVIFTLTSLEEINDYSVTAKKLGISLSIQLRLDFNGGVRGFLESEYIDAINKVKKDSGLKLVALCAHLYEAYSDDDVATEKTLEKYAACFDKLEPDIRAGVMINILTSFGFPKFREYAFDAVRIGTSMYGLPVEECQMKGQLRKYGSTTEPILSISAKIIKIVDSNHDVRIDYSGCFHKKSNRIGLVAIGCWDIPYFFKGSKCTVSVNGQLTEIIGKPCMDSCCVDLSEIKDAKPGDLVYFLGNEAGITLIDKLIENNISMCDSQELFIGMERLPKTYK